MKIKSRQKKTKITLNPSQARLNFLMLTPLIVGGLIGFRLFDLQIFKHNYYIALAEGQHKIFEDLIPTRGEIFVEDEAADELYPLAVNKEYNLVYAIPRSIENPIETAQKLAPVLEMDEAELLTKLDQEDDVYEPLKHKLDQAKSAEIDNLDLDGIALYPESWRFYTDNDLACHIMGFVGYVDDEQAGRYGIEGYYDDHLAGVEGFLESEKDIAGQLIAVGEKTYQPAADGDSLVLTIDRYVQFKVQKKVKEAVEKFGAQQGTIIVMEPNTGEIIAMANYPQFDPNKYNEVEDINHFSNSAIHDLYEPGSAFKPVVMAGAINNGLVGPATTITDTGSIDVDEFTIRNSALEANGVITMTQVLERSSNIGMVQVAQKLGEDSTFEYLNRFGFNDLSGIDLDTEIPTDITPPPWSDAKLATTSFGQGIATTPLRLANAYSAIANGGQLVKPRVVKKIIHPDGSEEEIPPREIRQVISSSTSQTMRAMLTSAVEHGYGTPARVPGHFVAGKTGTAQVPNANAKGYDPNQKITSFVGFGPVDKPRFVILVKLNNPGGDTWGANTAAPVFSEVAADLFKYYQIPPDK